MIQEHRMMLSEEAVRLINVNGMIWVNMYCHIQYWNSVWIFSKCWALNKRQLVRRQFFCRSFDKSNWDRVLIMARSLYVSSVGSKAKKKKSKHNTVKLWFSSCFYYYDMCQYFNSWLYNNFPHLVLSKYKSLLCVYIPTNYTTDVAIQAAIF